MNPTICRCCAGSMTTASVSTTNPHICLTCEQLLEKDIIEFEAMMAAKLAAQQNVTPLHEARPPEKIAA